MVLAARLTPGADLDAALDAYERQRRADIAPLQREALRNSRWFENLDRYVDQDALQFALTAVQPPERLPLFWRYVAFTSPPSGSRCGNSSGACCRCAGGRARGAAVP